MWLWIMDLLNENQQSTIRKNAMCYSTADTIYNNMISLTEYGPFLPFLTIVWAEHACRNARVVKIAPCCWIAVNL